MMKPSSSEEEVRRCISLIEGQMSIFDFKENREHYCMNCKHSYERSKFDIEHVGKWAYRYVCTLKNDYRQVTQSCDKWEDMDD